jgi:hypothetical protein
MATPKPLASSALAEKFVRGLIPRGNTMSSGATDAVLHDIHECPEVKGISVNGEPKRH